MDLAKIRKKAREASTSEENKPKRKRRTASRTSQGGESEKAARKPQERKQPAKANEQPVGRSELPRSATAGLPSDESRQALQESMQAEQVESQAENALERASAAGERLLIFSLGKEKYAIPIHEIALIIEELPITPVPNAPVYLSGIISLRGKVVSVLDVAARLETARRDSPESRKIIVLDMGADQFGLLVDAIDQLVTVDLQSLEPPPEGFKPVVQDFVAGVFHHTGQAIAFLNLPLFLNIQL